MDIEKLFLQKKYADLLSLRLDQHSLKSMSPYKSNFRCEICGDSSRNKHKKRGYLLEKEGGIMYYCHNGCGGRSIETFMKEYHPDLYQQFVFELFRSKDIGKFREKVEAPTTPVKIIPKGDYLNGLIPLSRLPPKHPAREYALTRHFPYKMFSEIFYCEKFMSYVNAHIPGKFKEAAVKYHDHDRIIFPLCKPNGDLFGVIGRAIGDQEVRYLTIKFDERAPKIYGLERWERKQHTYVLEGPIDSFYLPNAIALAGTDGDVNLLNLNSNNSTIVLDNQARNREVISKYAKYISQGHAICIWPDSVKYKDINAMICSGMTASDVKSIVDNNTFSGINAQIQFNKWKKV